MCFLNTGQVPVAVTFYINFKNRDVKHLKREHDKNLPVVEVWIAHSSLPHTATISDPPLLFSRDSVVLHGLKSFLKILSKKLILLNDKKKF